MTQFLGHSSVHAQGNKTKSFINNIINLCDFVNPPVPPLKGGLISSVHTALADATLIINEINNLCFCSVSNFLRAHKTRIQEVSL